MPREYSGEITAEDGSKLSVMVRELEAPVPEPEPTPEPTPEPEPGPEPEPEPEPTPEPTPEPEPEYRSHTVVAGDTYTSIARAYGVADWHDIQALNGTAPNALQVGQVLRIPPRTAPGPTPTPVPVEPVDGKVVMLYVPAWGAWDRDLRRIDSDYTHLILFAAHANGVQVGQVSWTYGQMQGVQEVRREGKKVLVSCGGANSTISFSGRAASSNFVASASRIIDDLGGADGLDMNTFEAGAHPNLEEYAWIAEQFRERYGPDFLITSPPAPWSQIDRAFCREMIARGLMNFAMPQYYDGPGAAAEENIVRSIGEWIAQVGQGDASKIVVGFGLGLAANNYSPLSTILNAYRRIEATDPDIGGAFLWDREADERSGWTFANQVAPIVKDAAGGVAGGMTGRV